MRSSGLRRPSETGNPLVLIGDVDEEGAGTGLKSGDTDAGRPMNDDGSANVPWVAGSKCDVELDGLVRLFCALLVGMGDFRERTGGGGGGGLLSAFRSDEDVAGFRVGCCISASPFECARCFER